MTQEKALALLKSGRNVFLTGSAGTGKTYVLNQYIAYLKAHQVPVAVTASTGIAATHLNGMTVHAWSGIGIRNQLSLQQLQRLSAKKYMQKKMSDVEVLIIDEISMLHKTQLDLVDEVVRYFKGLNTSFGGIQVVFCGDFFQLPPVGQMHETARDKFCFMSKAWVEADLNVCYLTQQYRQSKNELNFLLNQIRQGEVSQAALQLLEDKVQESYAQDSEVFPQLYTHNVDVDQINQQKIAEIESSEKKFKAKTKGNKVLVETVTKSVLAPEMLYLKEGAKVMFVRNNYEEGYFNGTLGVVKEFTEKGFPLIEVKDDCWIEVKPETWAVEDEQGKVLASFTQLPLRLAWAITVHKSQGMTLDAATIDLRKTFEKGQGYVALSRLRSLDQLTLKGVNALVMELEPLARKADARFLELSLIADQEYALEELTQEHKSFVLHCGGVLEKKKAKGKKAKKKTHEITKDLLVQGMSLDEIVKERDLVESTILRHFALIKQEDATFDFSFVSSDEKLRKKVKALQERLGKPWDELSLKMIYDAFQAEYSYAEIQRVLLQVI